VSWIVQLDTTKTLHRATFALPVILPAPHVQEEQLLSAFHAALLCFYRLLLVSVFLPATLVNTSLVVPLQHAQVATPLVSHARAHRTRSVSHAQALYSMILCQTLAL